MKQFSNSMRTIISILRVNKCLQSQGNLQQLNNRITEQSTLQCVAAQNPLNQGVNRHKRIQKKKRSISMNHLIQPYPPTQIHHPPAHQRKPQEHPPKRSSKIETQPHRISFFLTRFIPPPTATLIKN